MDTYQIENRLSGAVLGKYMAENHDHALHLMARDAGYRGLFHMEDVAPSFFGEINVIMVTS
tara:strand:- start:268 stop:450 length:183 start_codon:yes stop_codon:yes gene_type:complete